MLTAGLQRADSGLTDALTRAEQFQVKTKNSPLLGAEATRAARSSSWEATDLDHVRTGLAGLLGQSLVHRLA